MRSPFLPLLASGLAVALAACTPHPSIYADNAPVEAHDIRVFSADHLMIDGQDLTLADAEAPKPRGACEAEAAAGAEAAQAARAMLAAARHIDIRATDDDSGRRLVNVDGLDLGQSLIGQGLAVTRRPVAMDWCLRASVEPRRFAAADTSARLN